MSLHSKCRWPRPARHQASMRIRCAVSAEGAVDEASDAHDLGRVREVGLRRSALKRHVPMKLQSVNVGAVSFCDLRSIQ